MNTEKKRLVRISFPFELYFKQLFSADTYVRFINPFSFWRRYRINHLEICSELNIVEHLEHSYRLKWQLPRLTNPKQSKDYTDSLDNSLLKQTELNTIYISQPNIRLKYRGVSYYTRDVLSMNVKAIEMPATSFAIDPSLVKLHNFEQHSNSNNISTSETSSSN